MIFFRKKATFFEGCGKTAPQPVGPTEKRPETDRFGSCEQVTPTAPINGGGLVDTDRLKKNGIEGFGPTVGSDTVMAIDGRRIRPVAGWIVCVKGANLGRAFELHDGYNDIGRQTGSVVIPGDDRISRERHMLISYNKRNRSFGITRGNTTNAIFVNGDMLEERVELNSYDIIETGASAFLFIGFCGANFSWDDTKA